MWAVVLGSLGLAIVLNLAATPLRDRVSLTRTPDQLLLRNQGAALRLDGAVVILCLIALACAGALRSPTLIVASAAGAVIVGWRIIRTARAEAVVFDRPMDLVRRGDRPICTLGAIDGLDVVPQGARAGLELRYREAGGALARERLHRTHPREAAALQAAIRDFLTTRSG